MNGEAFTFKERRHPAFFPVFHEAWDGLTPKITRQK